MLAILSDIHANLEALRVVLDDLAKREVRQIYCLGDTVGYGPDPEPCVSLVRDFDVVLRGNFDDQVLSENPDTLPQLRQLGRWARNHLSTDSIRFLTDCPTRHVIDSRTFSHGGPLDNDYLFPEDVYNERKMANVFDRFHGIFFCGHSHIAGIHTMTDYITPESIEYRYRIDSADAVINVGSVGEPRDGDERACYVLVDGDVVRFIRLDYDIDTTVRKLRDDGFGPTYWEI